MSDALPTDWAEASLDQVTHINPPGASTVVPDDQAVTFVPMAAVRELSGRSLSGSLCARHSMTQRSMNATQDEDRYGGPGGAAADSS